MQTQTHPPSTILGRAHIELAVVEVRALAHAEQPASVRAGERRLRQITGRPGTAGVRHLELDPTGGTAELHAGRRRPCGVLERVGQGLLGDAEDRELDAWGE